MGTLLHGIGTASHRAASSTMHKVPEGAEDKHQVRCRDRMDSHKHRLQVDQQQKNIWISVYSSLICDSTQERLSSLKLERNSC